MPIEHDCVQRLGNARSMGTDCWSPSEWQAPACEAVRDLTSIFEQAQGNAVAQVQAMMGIVLRYPNQTGKQRGQSSLRRYGVSYMARCRGEERCTEMLGDTFLEHRGAELNSAACGSHSSVQRRDCAGDGQGSGRHPLGD